jgi:1-acyl-sn-glycerol-3-phosphate acyltransferase
VDYQDYQREEQEYHTRFKRYNCRKLGFFKWYFRLYHRLQVKGLENIPDGPAIIAPNHSGGFDLDIMSLMYFAHPARIITVLIAHEWHFISSLWGRYYVGGGIPLWLRGGIRNEYIDPYLHEGGARYPGLVCIFPEGNSGSIWKRKELRRFYPGVVRLAVRYRVPIVPVAMIGFDIASPIFKEIKRDHRTPDVVMLPFTLPATLTIEFGKPFELSEFYTGKMGRDEEFAVANEIVRPRIADVIRKYRTVSLPSWEKH